jgi:hypothetical protein
MTHRATVYLLCLIISCAYFYVDAGSDGDIEYAIVYGIMKNNLPIIQEMHNKIGATGITKCLGGVKEAKKFLLGHCSIEMLELFHNKKIIDITYHKEGDWHPLTYTIRNKYKTALYGYYAKNLPNIFNSKDSKGNSLLSQLCSKQDNGAEPDVNDLELALKEGIRPSSSLPLYTFSAR